MATKKKNTPGTALKTIDIDYSKPLPKWAIEVIETQYAIEHESARAAGSVGFMIRGLVNASMPYKDPKTRIFERRNGNTSLTMIGGYSKGLPYGRYPRLLLAWVTTEAVRTRKAELHLGDSLRDFLLNVVGVSDTGGQNGTRTRFIEQAARLFGAHITVEQSGLTSADGSASRLRIRNLSIGESADLDPADERRLWTPQQEGEAGKFQSTLTLSTNFFRECVDAPVPIDLRAYRALSNSALAMDVYSWLTYRMSYQQGTGRPIPWLALMHQFGSNYSGEKALSNFRRDFLTALGVVTRLYSAARVEDTDKGLVLRASPTHVAALAGRRQPGLF